MHNLKLVILFLSLIFVSSCEKDDYLGAPEQAANTAVDFGEQLFIKKDPKKAQSYFHEEYRKALPEWLLKQMMTEAEITHVEAVSYNDRLDQKGQILVYLEIKVAHNGAKVFVAVYTVGDSDTGYSIMRLTSVDRKIRSREALPGDKFSDRLVKIIRRPFFSLFH